MDINLKEVIEKLKKQDPSEKIALMEKLDLLPKPIDWNILDKVLIGLTKVRGHIVDNYHVDYFPHLYSFTAEEFRKSFSWIDDYASDLDVIIESEKSTFPSMDCFFYYKDNLYHWNLLIGQGSNISISHKKDGKVPDGFFAFILSKENVNDKIKQSNLGWSKVRKKFNECEKDMQKNKEVSITNLIALLTDLNHCMEHQHHTNLKEFLKIHDHINY